MPQINVVMDRSHASWVLGGLAREVVEAKPENYARNIIISKVRSKYLLISFFRIYFNIPRNNILVFMSITPFENFLKLRPFCKNKKIVWFTHSEIEPSDKLISTLNKADTVLCQSKKGKNELIELGVRVPIIPFMGAIDPSRFDARPLKGSKIAVIGTAANRKNPDKIILLAKKYPQISFQIIGKNWSQQTNIFNSLKLMKNVKYIEMHEHIKSSDLNNCSHYLMISSIEGGPISLIEAVASGLIPICTNTGIVEEFLDLVNYKDQIISSPTNFSDIITKYNYKYHQSQIDYSIKIAKQFSILRLSEIITSQAFSLIDPK
jgi:glycosyltransferase involved in cell wall biosynthesis